MGRVLSIKIDSELQGHRIDHVLKERLQISDALMKQLKKEKNGIMLNGTHSAVIDKVNVGDILTVNIKGKNAENIIPVNIPLDVLWEDEDILIVNKSGTMPVHPSRIHINDTLLNAVMNYTTGGEAVHIITRLDRETSGIVLIAKNPWAAALLGNEMKNEKIKKEYIAIINGSLKQSNGLICAPIKKKTEREILRFVSEDGKDAVTQYELIKKTDTLSWVKLYPITGRTHQLRVHMSYIGHPIYGDRMYGASQYGERTRLHCCKITFLHPVTREEISVTAEMPEDFKGLL